MEQKIIIIKNEDTKNLSHEINKYLKNALKIEALEDSHTILESNEKLLYGTDQKTFIHKTFYKELDDPNSKINYLYRTLAENICRNSEYAEFYDEWAIQRFPSFRAQFPNNISVFEFHKDSDYSHPLGEINNFLAVTECKDSAALHIEKNLGWENYQPLNLKSGELAQINTSIFKHGDFKNKEGFTRISIDFRFIPIKAIKNNKIGESITANKRMDESSYYYLFKL